MTALPLVRKELKSLGYEVVEMDYVFSDVFAASAPDRTVPLAAFTQSPPSYRNAAFAAVEVGRGDRPASDGYRALGAPLLLVIEGEYVTVWQVHADGRPTIHQRSRLEDLSALFRANSDVWNPRRIQAAKSFGLLHQSYQLDFIDAGLLPAIEGELHGKLDRLLNQALSETVRMRVVRVGEKVDDGFVFRTIFRLLAAKVLQDRGHELASTWHPDNIDSVLKAISTYYTLPRMPGEELPLQGSVFDAAWQQLRAGINFQNISSDNLSYVYENTLITAETRKHFGTHSTPRPVAEYVVGRLALSASDAEVARIYEPFAGAGVFMVAALRRLRELLPTEMTDRQRHDFLVKRICGDELEPFAKEVAILSLILADYPNQNGWKVAEVDLFKDFALAHRVQGANIVLCNPPFEPFTAAERTRYPGAAARGRRKAVAALEAILDARPNALGFVLPEAFIDGKHYQHQRSRIENLYQDIEIVALPDRVFKASSVRSALLIAQEPRNVGSDITTLRSTVVAVRDRDNFFKTGEVTDTRVQLRHVGSVGKLWIDELEEVWDALRALPRLSSVAEIHRGIEWNGDQADGVRNTPARGFRPGIHSADSVQTFALDAREFLDCRPGHLRRGASLDATVHKLIANAARTSRGPWCISAAIDRNELVWSQQLFGIWPKAEANATLETLGALLNGPIAVAYIASHSPPDRIRVATLRNVPIPVKLSKDLDRLVTRYIEIINDRDARFLIEWGSKAVRILHKIDADIMSAYDLPPRLERRVLEFFRGERRPTVHPWADWFPRDFAPYIPLRDYVSGEYRKAAGNWLTRAMKPWPADEAEAIREILDK